MSWQIDSLIDSIALSSLHSKQKSDPDVDVMSFAGYIEHDHETGQKKMVVYLRDKGPNDTWPGLGDLQWLGMAWDVLKRLSHVKSSSLGDEQCQRP